MEEAKFSKNIKDWKSIDGVELLLKMYIFPYKKILKYNII